MGTCRFNFKSKQLIIAGIVALTSLSPGILIAEAVDPIMLELENIYGINAAGGLCTVNDSGCQDNGCKTAWTNGTFGCEPSDVEVGRTKENNPIVKRTCSCNEVKKSSDLIIVTPTPTPTPAPTRGLP